MRRQSLAGGGCRDPQGKFVPVPQCTGRKRAKLKPQKPPGKPTKPRVVSKPTKAKKAAPERLLRDPWLRSSPFTKEQTDRYNRYTHFEIDFNEEFDVEIDRIEKHVADTLEKYQTHQADIDIAKSEVNKYRRKLYDYYLSKFDLQSYYPPVSVVGPGKYPYQKKSKAAAREKKMLTTWQKAVAEFDREISRITKGRTAKEVTFQWSEVALAMNRLSFGKSYAQEQIKRAKFPNAEAFASTYRKRGRELHKDLVRNAVDRGTPIEYIAVKDYPDLLERAHVLHAPAPKTPETTRSEIEKKKGARIIAERDKEIAARQEKELLKILGNEKMHIEDLNWYLYREVGMPRAQVSATLLRLELKRKVRQSAGKMFEATKAPKMAPPTLEELAFRIDDREEDIIKRIEKGEKFQAREVGFSYLLQKANKSYPPDMVRNKLIVAKEAREQSDHAGYARNKLSAADDKKYGKIVLEMLQKPEGVHHETLIDIFKGDLRQEQVLGLIGRLYLAGKIFEISRYHYKTAPEGYTPMRIREVEQMNAPKYLGYVPSPRERSSGKKLKPVKDFYMYVKKGFRKPKSVGIHEASFYQREMERYGRGTLYQVRARTADEARALIKAGKKEPARPALKPRAPRRTEAEKEALWEKLILEAARTKYLDLDIKLRPVLTPEQLKLFGRVRYNSGDLNSTVKAAQKTVGEKPLYIFGVHGGYTIAKRKPPATQVYLVVKPDKTVETHNPEYLSRPAQRTAQMDYSQRIFAMPMSIWEGYAQRMTEAEFASRYAHAYMRTVKRPSEKSVKAHKADAKILYWQLRKVEPEQMRLFGKVSYKPQAWERARGERNYYLHAAFLSDGSILFIEKHTVGDWLRRKETIRVEYHAVGAYSEEHARMIIEAGGSKPYYLSIGHHYRTPKAAEQLRLFGFSGFSGDISTCAYWIATNGDWTCGSYLPTCEAQSPGACKIPPPAGYKFCSTTQKVKSDPKGRYGGKLITRCKTYRSRCLPDSGCIEDKLFPKPEVFKLDKKEVRDIAASMAKEFNLLQKESGPALAREILDRGGLKAYRGESATEEWAAMPLHLKRKSGMTMDEMASEMGFEHETAFRAAVEKAYPPGKKTIRRKTWKDYKDEAEQILIDQEQRSEYAYEEPVPF